MQITAANAQEMAAKSLASRRQAATMRAIRLAVPAQTPQIPAQLADYHETRLTRVRVMLDELDAQQLKTRDPQQRERLARAQTLLAEQERILAGRPLPGARRPGPASDRPASTLIEPL